MSNYKTMLITPEYARELMDGNTHNRAIRTAWVEQLARLITEGKWCKDANTISIGKNNRVLNGQHRLAAIIKANKAVEATIAFGVPDDAYKWMDNGIKRMAQDRIHLVDNDGINRFACSITTAYIKAAKSKSSISIDMIEDEFIKMSDSFVYVASCFAKPTAKLTISPIGAAFVSYHNKHPIKAVDAMDNFISGHNLEEGDPMLLLRESLFTKRLNYRMPVHELYWKTINVLCAHLNNVKIHRLNCSTEDFSGNVYDKLVWRRTLIGEKGAETKASRSS